MVTPAMHEWYAGRTTKQIEHELRSARKAYAAARSSVATDPRARVVVESNEAAIPMLEALLKERLGT